MSGARPSTFRKGGGFLNGVDGEVTGYEFTTEFPNSTVDNKRKKGSDFTPLYAVLSVRVDGGDEDVTTTLFVGSADDYEIESEGHTLVPVEEGTSLWASADWSKLVASMVEAGMPDTDLPEDEINFEAIVGRRFRFVQVKDAEATEKRGKRKDKKTGKEYDRTSLQVSEYYGEATKTAATKTKSAAPAAKTATRAAGKPNGKAVEVNLTEDADAAILAVLADNDGSISKRSLPVKLAQKVGPKAPNAADVRRLAYSDEHLLDMAERGLITYDQSSKAQTLEAC